jgi:hypothetical protein
METPQAARLVRTIIRNKADFKGLCHELDEDTASRAPAGRWSPKEIISHLCGPDGTGHMPTIQAFIEEDAPRLDIEAENAFFSEKRAQMTLAELLDEFDKEYERMAELVAGLSEEQLTRKANIPMLKESPWGEYPTLSQWIQLLGDYHLGSHIGHMREILDAIEAMPGPPSQSVSQESQESPSIMV